MKPFQSSSRQEMTAIYQEVTTGFFHSPPWIRRGCAPREPQET